jgi:hypothetical protein
MLEAPISFYERKREAKLVLKEAFEDANDLVLDGLSEEDGPISFDFTLKQRGFIVSINLDTLK